MCSMCFNDKQYVSYGEEKKRRKGGDCHGNPVRPKGEESALNHMANLGSIK